MKDLFATGYREALNAMELRGPRRLHALAESMIDDPTVETGDAALRAYLNAAGPNDPLSQDMAVRLATWDAVAEPEWASETSSNTNQRRDRVLHLLAIDEQTAALLNQRFVMATNDDTVIDGPWQPWYSERLRQDRSFYWDHYSKHLLAARSLGADAVAALDAATTRVVERLSDPTRAARHQAKGLVVGYVQSGKTANFTGVIAKAIDAGYRLVIVLTGSTDLLRSQTQRRLDMELVGRENLLRGISEEDTESFDYHADRDWMDGNFLSHGCLPSDVGRPDIGRLTTRDFDYRSLQQGISALDFQRRDRAKPFYEPVNLFDSDARLVVVKKNGIVLQKLVKDLGKITMRLAEIPALIIDDESDQASPNTTNPAKWEEDRTERTTINRRIGQLLGALPRAQYVGYTATPFANVFIDPSDVEDIFPSDFLISLGRPSGYMGAADFQDDFDTDIANGDDGGDGAESVVGGPNERAHVRPIPDDDDEENPRLREAIDAFVLTGAIKLFRQDRGVGQFRHHTMLVHHAMKRMVHREKAEAIRLLWKSGGYYSTAGAERLRDLYERDIRPASLGLGSQDPLPDSYDALRPYIARAINEIGRTDDPVIVVNSDKDLEKEDIDFDQRPVWRILVGGNSLARGFTIEGLTISYYRRLTKQQDTLMQMGRWFGFRQHYRDLVRLYITPTLHQAFAASCRDEEHFRAELRRYAVPVDGRRQITPAEIPPLVAQHLRWLKPTAANKMYNAELHERRSPGLPVEPRRWPSDPIHVRHNTLCFRPLLEAASTSVRFFGTDANPDKPREAQRWDYLARVGTIPHDVLVVALGSLKLVPETHLRPDLRWLTSLTSDTVERWLVIFPQQKNASTRRSILHYPPLSVFTRTRLRSDYYGAISEVAHRMPVRALVRGTGQVGDDEANQLVQPRTGVILIYPTVDRLADSTSSLTGTHDSAIDAGKVTLGFHLVAPPEAVGDDRRLVVFRTKDSSRVDEAIIDRTPS